jgi:O-antigen ligase
MFSSIDNHYLMFVLQCGFLGLGLFLALCATTTVYAWSAAARADGATRRLAAVMAGSLFALTLLMTSVWLPSDYRFVLLAMMGAAGGLRLICVARRSEVASPLRSSSFPLQLSPGHRVTPAV